MKILVLRDASVHATALLRYYAPMYYLEKAGHQVKYREDVTVSLDGKKLLDDEIAWADIIISGQFLFKENLADIKILKRMGKKVILDADDWYLESHLKRPKSDVEAYKEIALMVDGITTVSKYLGELYHRVIGVPKDRIFYLPNCCITESWIKTLPSPRRDKITIGLMGATNHVPDWRKMALPVLREIKKKYPEVGLSCFGKPKSIAYWIMKNKDIIQESFLVEVSDGFKEMEEMGFEFIDPVADQEDFPSAMKKLGWHIGLATLSNTRTDKAKSFLKYFDYSMAGIAGVYQGISPFTEAIKSDESNGMMANSKQEWIDDISFLIENPDAVKNIVEIAQEDIKQNHSFSRNWHKWEEVYQEILKKP